LTLQNNIMKKILITVFTAILFAANAFAQSEIKEGHVTYTITISGNEQAAQMMNGAKMSITVKDSLTRTDMDLGMWQTKTIMNNVTKKGTMLMDVMGNKYAIALTADDIKEQEKNVPNYDVKYIDSTKIIVGHTCKKAIVTIKAKGGDKTFTIWYDPTIKAPGDIKNMYDKINGLPLEFTMEQGAGGQSLDMVFVCTVLDNKPVDASTFTIPDGYTAMSMDQFKNAMSGMGGGH
jgi:hypothetical protein